MISGECIIIFSQSWMGINKQYYFGHNTIIMVFLINLKYKYQYLH